MGNVRADIKTKLEQAHQAFREKVKGYITDVNNKDMKLKAEQTIAERQGELLSEQAMLKNLKAAHREAPAVTMAPVPPIDKTPSVARNRFSLFNNLFGKTKQAPEAEKTEKPKFRK